MVMRIDILYDLLIVTFVDQSYFFYCDSNYGHDGGDIDSQNEDRRSHP